MYTVVIAEQKHLDSIREHDLFLQPFLENNNAVFCAWNTEEDTLSKSVPDLRKATLRGDKWRAIIVADEAGRTQKNPFDRVQHKDPIREKGESDEAYLERRTQSRLADYEKAAAQPLSRLVAYLCDFPSISAGGEGYLTDDPEFCAYRIADAKKKELQKAIIGTEPADFVKPSEVICIARRTYEDEQYDIRAAWETHINLEYSHFADYNLYYPKMRYLLFDIVAPEHRNYRFDNVRFLYALLLLAGHDLPGDALQTGKVYTLDCRNDNEKLSALLQAYDDRLTATQKSLEEEIAILRHTDPQKLTDKEMGTIFFGKTGIAVRPEGSFDESEIYVHPRRFGCFSDRPEEETEAWRQEYHQSKSGLAKYLKQPKRAIRLAVTDTHLQTENQEAVEKVHLLNDQQIGDLREHLDNVEAAVVDARPENLADPTKYMEAAEKSAEEVSRYLKTRMTQKTGIAAIAITLAAFLAGVVPMLLTGSFSLVVTLVLVGAIVLILATAYICLLIQRGKLRGKMRAYNDSMRAVSRSIQSNMERYSVYLGRVCDLIKGNRANNALTENCDELQQSCRVYEKHIADIKDRRSECGLTFSQFLQAGQERNVNALPFTYDFRKVTNYRYPIISGETKGARVEFLQKGNIIELPVDFIRCVELRREELYD